MPIKGFNLAEAFGQAEAIKGARMQNRLGEMQLDAERDKQAKTAARNVLAQQFLAQQPEGPTMSGAEMPLTQDPEGYTQALYGQGDIEGARGEEERMRGEEKQALDRVSKIMAINPKMGVKAWAEDPLLGQKHGPIEHMGVKEGMQIYRDSATGEISGVNKQTGEVRILKEGGAPKEKPFEGATRELGARGKVENLVGKEMQAKYGKAGLRYDPIMGDWIFPPNFDQTTFWNDYNKRKESYFKKFKLSPIEEEKTEWPAPLNIEKTGRPPIESFFE